MNNNSTNNWPSQTFIIAKEVITSIPKDTVEKIFEDMIEANVYFPPYENFVVTLPPGCMSALLTKQAYSPPSPIWDKLSGITTEQKEVGSLRQIPKRICNHSQDRAYH
jgi:hypothetical protein